MSLEKGVDSFRSALSHRTLTFFLSPILLLIQSPYLRWRRMELFYQLPLSLENKPIIFLSFLLRMLWLLYCFLRGRVCFLCIFGKSEQISSLSKRRWEELSGCALLITQSTASRLSNQVEGVFLSTGFCGLVHVHLWSRLSHPLLSHILRIGLRA